jgi:hypothetical protein
MVKVCPHLYELMTTKSQEQTFRIILCGINNRVTPEEYNEPSKEGRISAFIKKADFYPKI